MKNSKNSITKAVILLLIGMLLVKLTPYILHNLPFVKNVENLKSIIIQEVTLSSNDIISITFFNKGFNDVKDISVQCDLITKSGAVLDSINFTAYSIVESNSKITVNERVEQQSLQLSDLTCKVKELVKLDTHNKKRILVGDGTTVNIKQDKKN